MSYYVEGTEGLDFVVCRECGFRSAKLYNHIVSHGITARDYGAKHGEGAPLRCQRTAARASSTRVAKLAPIPKSWKETKEVPCTSCGTGHKVHKSMGSLHDLRCPKCKVTGVEAARVSLWEGEEGDKYVTCLECGHRAENLTSHLTSKHPDYRLKHPDAQIVARSSAILDKVALRGLVRPESFRKAVSAGKTLGLTLEDFRPFLEPDGTVDHWVMEETLDITHPTLVQYAKSLGLQITNKHVVEGALKRRIPISVADITPFKMKNGKVSLLRASHGLKLSKITLRKACTRLGLPVAHHNVSQHMCLEGVSTVLGGMPYEEEWTGHGHRSPKGWVYRYDGYFAGANLVVEIHGHQHYTFPNAYMRDESYRPLWEAMLWRDGEKERLMVAAGIRYLCIRDDEPFADIFWLRERLIRAGVIPPRYVIPVRAPSSGDVLDPLG